MPMHPAWAKNIARRVLWAALEDDISKEQREKLVSNFHGKCAYCEQPLPKRWHADHIKNVDQGGFNHISNRVPSCPQCNEGEKKDKPWRRFLAEKYPNAPVKLQRIITRIEKWIAKNKMKGKPVNQANREIYNVYVTSVSDAIQTAWDALTRVPHSLRKNRLTRPYGPRKSIVCVTPSEKVPK